MDTEPIHFTQEIHDVGSSSGIPRKEWKVLVNVPMEHSSDLRAENKVLTVTVH